MARVDVYGKEIQKVTVTPVVAGTVVVNGDVDNRFFSNRGATGTVKFILPPAKAGMGPFTFFLETAQRVEIDPTGTESVSLAGADQTGGSYVFANTVGAICELVCFQDGKWKDLNQRGTWAAGIG